MSLAADILRAAKAKIEKPENWLQIGWYASDESKLRSVSTDTGTCFCARGAIMSVAGFHNCAERYLEHALQATGGGRRDVSCWNDEFTTTHADVLNLFDKAIELAEAGHG